MFLSELLDEYGKPYERLSGRGQLEAKEISASVDWAAAQYPDGQVLLACQGDASAFGVFMSGPDSFVGEAVEDIKVDCDKLSGELPLLRHLPDDEMGGWAVYRLSLLHADLPASGPPGVVRYLLTNFEFDSPRTRREPVTVYLSGVDGPVRLVPLSGDTLAPDRLRALRRARPTAWLEIQSQDGHAVRARQVANNICNLLSVARGTKIAWIQEEIVSTAGAPTHRFYSNRVTKPYSPFAPIDSVRIGGIGEFLVATYETYCRNRERYRLDRGTIDSALDAKLETDFLETRGAKLAVALEALKQNVLLASDPHAGFHLRPEEFAESLEAISHSVRSVLIENGVEPDSAAGIAAPQRFLGLNRRSFAHLLRRICRKLDLTMSRADLDLFVRCRNSLVHRGEFYCTAASQSERAKRPPKATKIQEYLFLISVVDAFLLSLVGYKGRYLVRTDGSEWEEREL